MTVISLSLIDGRLQFGSTDNTIYGGWRFAAGSGGGWCYGRLHRTLYWPVVFR